MPRNKELLKVKNTFNKEKYNVKKRQFSRTDLTTPSQSTALQQQHVPRHDNLFLQISAASRNKTKHNSPQKTADVPRISVATTTTRTYCL